MLNSSTRAVLGQLGAINQSQIISYPVTVIKMGKSMQAFLDVSNTSDNGCNEEEFDEIGVYSINELNSVINVIDNAEITNTNGTLTIKNDHSSIKYGTTSIEIVESECRGNPEMINKIKNPERNTKVLSFDLDIKSLDKIKKMSTLLKELSDLQIESKDGAISLTVTAKERSSNNFVMNMDKNASAIEDICMVLVMDNVNKLPASNYIVQVFKSAKGSLVSVFTSTNVAGLDIVISAKAI